MNSGHAVLAVCVYATGAGMMTLICVRIAALRVSALRIHRMSMQKGDHGSELTQLVLREAHSASAVASVNVMSLV